MQKGNFVVKIIAFCCLDISTVVAGVDDSPDDSLVRKGGIAFVTAKAFHQTIRCSDLNSTAIIATDCDDISVVRGQQMEIMLSAIFLELLLLLELSQCRNIAIEYNTGSKENIDKPEQ